MILVLGLLIGTSFFYVNQKNILYLDIEGHSHVDSIYSNIQRISKLELENSGDDSLIMTVDTIISELLPYGKTSIYFNNNLEVQNVVESIVESWYEFKLAVDGFRHNSNRDELFLISETIYNNSVGNSKVINTHISKISTTVDNAAGYLAFLIILLGLLLVKILLNTNKELQKNKELSKDMFLDTSTGLFNRSKCQEVLKGPVTQNTTKERAVIVCDLNGLKKTNDEYGHRAGDQLISCFAQELKNATNISPYDIFVGRYGGDEFMVSFDYAELSDVQGYIKEVNFLMKQFNENQDKPFKLSCAMGYAITDKDTKHLTMRELFDMADENMYKNKVAMKEEQRLKLIEQGIKVDDVVDDRL